MCHWFPPTSDKQPKLGKRFQSSNHMAVIPGVE
jgi:hypothetical protein